MIIAIYSNIAVFVQVFVGSVGYSIYCDIPTNNYSSYMYAVYVYYMYTYCTMYIAI